MSDSDLVNELLDRIKNLELDVQYQLHLNEELQKKYDNLIQQFEEKQK
jgi:hypothetical protein